MSVVDLGNTVVSLKFQQDSFTVQFWNKAEQVERKEFFNIKEEITDNVKLQKIIRQRKIMISGNEVLKITTKDVKKTYEKTIIGQEANDLEYGIYDIFITSEAQFRGIEDGVYVLKFKEKQLGYSDAVVMLKIKNGRVKLLRPSKVIVEDLKNLKEGIKSTIKSLNDDITKNIVETTNQMIKKHAIDKKDVYLSSPFKRIEASEVLIDIDIDVENGITVKAVEKENKILRMLYIDSKNYENVEKHAQEFVRSLVSMYMEKLRNIVKFEVERRKKIREVFKGVC